MLHEREISGHSYRAPLNPDFVRRVLARRKAEADAEAAAERRAISEQEQAARQAKALRDAEVRAEARRLAAQAKAAFEAAKAKLAEQYNAELDVERKIAFEAALKALGAAGGAPIVHTYLLIEARAMKVFKVSKMELRGVRRNQEVCFARQFVMYWTRRLTTLTLPQIGRLMGGRDHTTVLHGSRVYVGKRRAQGRTIRAAR